MSCNNSFKIKLSSFYDFTICREKHFLQGSTMIFDFDNELVKCEVGKFGLIKTEEYFKNGNRYKTMQYFILPDNTRVLEKEFTYKNDLMNSIGEQPASIIYDIQDYWLNGKKNLKILSAAWMYNDKFHRKLYPAYYYFKNNGEITEEHYLYNHFFDEEKPDDMFKFLILSGKSNLTSKDVQDSCNGRIFINGYWDKQDLIK